MRRHVPRASTRKRSLVIAGHKTSVSLEDKFWIAFGEMAQREKCSYSELAKLIDHDRKNKQNLSSAIRVFILEDLMKRARESEQRALENEGLAETLKRTVKSLIEERDREARSRGGLAPISAVIARSRSDA